MAENKIMMDLMASDQSEHQTQTDYMLQGHIKKLTVAQLVKKFLILLWNTEVCYHVHISLPLMPVLSQLNPPVHTLTPYFFRVHFKINYPPIYAQDSSSGLFPSVI
jgi:hypothetical protein